MVADPYCVKWSWSKMHFWPNSCLLSNSLLVMGQGWRLHVTSLLQPSSSSSHADNYFALLSGTSGPVDLRLLLVSGRDGGGVRNQWGLCTLVDISRLVHSLKLLQSLSLCLSIDTISHQLCALLSCHFLSLQNSLNSWSRKQICG